MQGVGKCKLNNTKVEPDDWFTDLSQFNNRMEKIGIGFKKIEKKLEIHITNNMFK